MSESFAISVLGDRGSVLGFRAIGLDTHFAETPDEARPILKKLARDSAIIYITENLAAGLKSDIDAYTDRVTPAIITIPGKSGSLGLGMSQLKSAVERAVGANILET
ncbi:MAG: V-type ATP synthase subunit F [Oscillospiraceae bacterium]|jgi:V/A-type H+-transporting ATPase subunit F|nr:V-type ATP synthase subunit F [Oscillospiraceae bacterium]